MSFVGTVITRTARKDHRRCEWCGEQIKNGEQYKVWTWFEDGWSETKMYIECHAAITRGDDWDNFCEGAAQGRRGMSLDESDEYYHKQHQKEQGIEQ